MNKFVTTWLSLRVEFDDQILADVRVAVFTSRISDHAPAAIPPRQPGRHDSPSRPHLLLHYGHHERGGSERDHVAGLDQEGRNIDLLIVDPHVAVADQLPGHWARAREADSIDCVIQASFEQLQEVYASGAGHPARLSKESAELLL